MAINMKYKPNANKLYKSCYSNEIYNTQIFFLYFHEPYLQN